MEMAARFEVCDNFDVFSPFSGEKRQVLDVSKLKATKLNNLLEGTWCKRTKYNTFFSRHVTKLSDFVSSCYFLKEN